MLVLFPTGLNEICLNIAILNMYVLICMHFYICKRVIKVFFGEKKFNEFNYS